MPYTISSLLERFTAKYVISNSTGCWDWIAAKVPTGYGVLWDYRYQNSSYAHRIAWELFNGAIPIDKEIDHLCRNRCCVNPLHLELVSHTVNMRRGVWPKHKADRFYANSLVTHCPRGHEYNEENTYNKITLGGKIKRNCRVCNREKKMEKKYAVCG